MLKMRLADPDALAHAGEVAKLSEMNAALFEQNAKLTELVESYRTRHQQLETENQALRLRSAQDEGGPANDKAIAEIKRKFVTFYHPDNFDGFEKTMRQEVFKEFFEVIKEVEEKYRSQ